MTSTGSDGFPPGRANAKSTILHSRYSHRCEHQRQSLFFPARPHKVAGPTASDTAELARLISAYATPVGSVHAARSNVGVALFDIGAAALLLFIGIHNAWDAVTYHIFFRKPE